ncbi:MAG: preQ(1) synthase [Nitrosopumilus sp.]
MDNTFVEKDNIYVEVEAIQNKIGLVGTERKCWPDIYAFLDLSTAMYVKSHDVTPEGVLHLVLDGDVTITLEKDDWLIKHENDFLSKKSSDEFECIYEKAENKPDLMALNVSAEKNKALYNFDFPDPKILEKFPTPKGHANLSIEIKIPDFTSLCPITGQPDWANITIDYTPDKWCVESKSMKLYKEGFRNFGEFHEACVQRICSDLVDLLDPLYVCVHGDFVPRGGIPIIPTAEYSRKSK